MKKITLIFAFALISCSAHFGRDASAENWRESEMKIEIQVTNESKVTTTLFATLADNSSAKSFTEKLQNGALTVEMSDYGNFEKVGNLPFSLPKNDVSIKTDAGDIILYQGNQITIYYDTNSWNLTRLGKLDAIEDGSLTKEELKTILGKGNIHAVISLLKK
ncbi:MAG: hypothetical protein HDR51_00350 [Treponema sp.]|nr:hypothetical protein [Treponema sp.]